MNLNVQAPWHKQSFERFLEVYLPKVLSERIPLTGYHCQESGPDTCCVSVSVASGGGEIAVPGIEIPQPDENGVFRLEAEAKWVIPVASNENLELSEIKCVGEQLLEYIDERLGEAPEDLVWDKNLAQTWLPLDQWVRHFLVEKARQWPETNWLSKQTALRQVWVTDRKEVIHESHFGRACLYETPEGPNIGHCLSVALGANIQDGKLVVRDSKPEAAIGLTASMVPFLEHNGPNRQLMGVNYMRTWLVPPDPEPALVQTGNEPDAEDFWTGRNLLTAYVSWGPGTYEDAILVSESCAKRLAYPIPLEPGDWLGNRHGTRGTVARILPDEEMPHLPDGTPVELVFSFLGFHTRLNFGQVREAVMSRIARAEGAPAVVPPFRAPGDEELKERLREAGLPESGMEHLTLGRGGRRLPYPSTWGWVYWGKFCYRTVRRTHPMHFSTTPEGRNNRQGELEYYVLRNAGAYELIRETFNTRSARGKGADKVSLDITAGPLAQAGPPTPAFADLCRSLSIGGIRAELESEGLRLRLAEPSGEKLSLARPVPHPWDPCRTLSAVGILGDPEIQAVRDANERVRDLENCGAPRALKEKAFSDLRQRVEDYLDLVLSPQYLRLSEQVLFSGRSTASPGENLAVDQLGIPDEMAWGLFGPLVIREMGNDKPVRERTPEAGQVLDRVMRDSWIILTRAPAVLSTSILAFHPVRDPGRVIRMNPIASICLNSDFDGDQVAVFLPLTEAGQKETRERLSLAGHLRRDPSLLGRFIPCLDALWGLAWLSLSEEGLREICDIAECEITIPEGYINRLVLMQAMAGLLRDAGPVKTLAVLDRLRQKGLEAAKKSGASISPFAGEGLLLPPIPQEDDVDVWEAYCEEAQDIMASRMDFHDSDLGPQLLAVKSEARGSFRHLACLVGPRGLVVDAQGDQVPIRHGLREGMPVRECFTCTVGARKALAAAHDDVMVRQAYGIRERDEAKGYGFLARAMRSQHPGKVFARAAANGEIDPLRDIDSRLFVGLPVQETR